jgi:hypothetical protein
MHLSDLVAATGMKSPNLRKLLHNMVRDGEVTRPERGIYAVPLVTSVTG